MIHYVKDNEETLGIIIKSNFTRSQFDIEFFTDDSSTQQLGYMKRHKGHEIIPHRHIIYDRIVSTTSEVLIIKSGIVRVDFYNDNERYLKSYILEPNDIVLLQSGGHGFEIIEDAEIFEIKQGPFSSEHDKIRFQNKNITTLKIHEL